MEYLKIQALMIVYTISVIMVQSCPLNCASDEYRTVCVVKTCEDELPFEYTDYLVIDGPLCVNQLMFLNALTPNTIIVMRTHSCEGLRNCRDERVLTTQVPRENLPTEMFSEDDFIPEMIPIPIPPHLPQPEAEVIPEIEQPEPEVVPEIQPEVIPEIEQPEPEVVPEIQPEPEPEPEVVPEIQPETEMDPEIEQPEVEAEIEIEQPTTEAIVTTTEGTTAETPENALVPIEEEDDDDDEGNNSTVSIYRG